MTSTNTWKTPLKKLAYHKNLGIAILVLTFAFGLIIGVFLKNGIFEFETKINIIDVASLIATFYIAYFVATYFETKKEANKVDKELVLKRIEEVYALVQDVDGQVNSGKISYIEAASYAKRVSVSIRNVGLLLDVAKIGNETITGTAGSIYSNIKNIKNLLTTTPANSLQAGSQIDNDLSVSEGVISISESRIQEIEMVHDELKFVLLKYQMQINQYTL